KSAVHGAKGAVGVDVVAAEKGAYVGGGGTQSDVGVEVVVEADIGGDDGPVRGGPEAYLGGGNGLGASIEVAECIATNNVGRDSESHFAVEAVAGATHKA